MLRKFTMLLLAVALGLGLVATPAQAADGRANTTQGEFRAVLHHAMGRNADGPQPDYHSVPYYQAGIKPLGCQWGVVEGTFKMVTSEQAKRRWGYDSQHLAGMLYAAVLDRAPDQGGLQTNTWAIGRYGLEWTARQMLGSGEYRARLGRICGVTALSASMYDWQTAEKYVQGRMLDDAIKKAKVCGSQKVINKLTDFKENVKKLRAYVGVMGEGAQFLNGLIGNDPCKATAEIIKAMAHIAYVVHLSGYDNNNPVFIQLEAKYNRLNMLEFTYRVGPNPTSWTAYSGKSF
jgi:hypothetical protein